MMNLFSPLMGCLLLALGVLVGLVKPLLLSPLNKIPGPMYSKFTSLVLKWHEFHANRTTYIHRLHLRYGPVVRLAPNEVAFASASAVKEIYGSGGSGYDKTGFYDLFLVYGRRTVFTTLGKEDHAQRKRAIAERYANSNIVRGQSLRGIAERAQNFVKLCHHQSRDRRSLDVFIALHSYAFDCVTHHLFHPYGSSSLQSQQDEAVMREITLDDSLQNRLVQYYSPALHKVIGGLLSMFAKPRKTPRADSFVLEAAAKRDTAPFTLVNRLQDKAGSENKYADNLDIAAECLVHMIGGIDTAGDALCFLMWELSQPRALPVQVRLQQEVRNNPEVAFDQLPFLDAVVLEGLRCWPAIPMSLPRHVPRGGRAIDGFFLPGAAIVSCQAYSVHRLDPKVFPDPDKFDPDRWLADDGGDAARKRLFFAFSTGARGCVGKHLALAEMKILLRAVYSHFTTLPDETMSADMMVMANQLISTRPLGQKCLLRFEPIAAATAPHVKR